MNQIKKSYIQKLLKPRAADTHKGDYGHALLIAGTQGSMGAGVIAARACLRTGAGLLTVCIPAEERLALQVGIPEAMLVLREQVCSDIHRFSCAGIGPGLGTSSESAALLSHFLQHFNASLVLDADALNLIAADPVLFGSVPSGSVLTPHPKEFDRLFGVHATTEDRMHTAIAQAKERDIVIVLKGHKTLVASATKSLINTTGNPGLAKGGSGDALTGMITAFLAQGYTPFDAATLGVYLHGYAADLALRRQSLESMLITDVIECMGQAFKKTLGRS